MTLFGESAGGASVDADPGAALQDVALLYRFEAYTVRRQGLLWGFDLLTCLILGA